MRLLSMVIDALHMLEANVRIFWIALILSFVPKIPKVKNASEISDRVAFDAHWKRTEALYRFLRDQK